MKSIYLKAMALLAGLSLGGGGLKTAYASKDRKQFSGEDKVQWEEKWYPLEDGAAKKLLVRRGIGQGGLWTQFRNDYDENVHSCAVITTILKAGEKLHQATHFDCQAKETETLPPVAGAEISKVEITELNFEPEAK